MPDRRITGWIGHEDLTRAILSAAGLPPDATNAEIVMATLAPTTDERIGVGLHFEVLVGENGPQERSPAAPDP